MDHNLHSLPRRLIELRIEHADLDNLIDAASNDISGDELSIRRLKKKRLQLRDHMAQIEAEPIRRSPPEHGAALRLRSRRRSGGALERGELARPSAHCERGERSRCRPPSPSPSLRARRSSSRPAPLSQTYASSFPRCCPAR